MQRTLQTMLALCFVLGAGDALAQTRELSGTVAGNDARPVAGANVQVVGTSIGTLADQAGRFVLAAPAGPVRLRVSMIGFRTREVDVPAGQNAVAVALEQDVLNIEGVVVTGQATTVARRNLANAVATVSAQDVERAPAQTVDKALQGKIVGANIQTNSGAPGGGVQVSLRGVSSINAASEPLWVVDGVVVSNISVPSGQNAVTRASPGTSNASVQDAPTNRIADINPGDIESIEVLKGASAAAIYGSKASNGVILVTTKRGRAGAPRIQVSQQVGQYRLANTIGARNWTLAEAQATFPARTDLGNFFNADGSPRQVFDHERQLADQNDLSSQTSVSVSGGTENTRYFVSGLAQNDRGVIWNTGFERRSLRINLDQRVGQRIDVGLNTNLINTHARRGLTNNDNSGTSFYMVLPATPNFVDLSRRDDGTFPANPFGRSNPLQTAHFLDNGEEVWRMIGVGNLRVDLLERGPHALRIMGTAGTDYLQQENNLFSPPILQFEAASTQPGTALRGNTSNLNLNGNVNLVHTFAPVEGSLRATTSFGMQYEDRDMDIVRAVGRNLIAGRSSIDAATSVQMFRSRQRVRDFGLYAQEEMLVFDERMLLTAGLRADRSSNNGDPSQFFLYPKAAVSYRIPGLTALLDEVKLRAAYGETGNQPLFGQKFTPLNATQNIQGQPGLVVGGTAGDPDIRPERQREVETGLDATLFGGMATFEFTFYNQRITDLLLQRTIAPSTGFTTQFFNGGELLTRGVEVALATTPIRTDRFSWFSRATFYRNRSTIEQLPVPSFRTGAFGSTNLGVFQIEEGKSATQIVGRDRPDPNGPVIERAMGDANPDFKMGFTNELTFGNFEVFALVDWQQGGHVINLTKLLYDFGSNSPDFALPAGATPRPVSQCHPNCRGAERVAGFGTFTQQYIEDASFVKLREVSLTYTLPATLARRVWGGVERAQISLSGRNLFTLTDYTGLDPEVSNFGNQQIARNVDVAPYPPSRSFWLSINLGL